MLESFVAQSGNTAVDAAIEELFDEEGNVRGGCNVREYLIARTREHGAARGHDYSGLSPDQMIDDWHYLVFPGMVFNTHAGGFLLFRVRPDWHDPDLCTFDVYHFVWPAAGDRDAFVLAANMVVPERGMSFGQVLDQDFENLPGVQRGLHSDGLDFITISAQEIRVAHVHAAIDDFVARP